MVFALNTRRFVSLASKVKLVALVVDENPGSTTWNEVIIDPCVGSHITMIAAERTERRTLVIEVYPKLSNSFVRI